MKSKLNHAREQQKPDGLEAELDKLEDMWDNIIARGDDDYYETVQHHRQKLVKDKEQPEKRHRRRGKRM
jgi:hypothetical protein